MVSFSQPQGTAPHPRPAFLFSRGLTSFPLGGPASALLQTEQLTSPSVTWGRGGREDSARRGRAHTLCPELREVGSILSSLHSHPGGKGTARVSVETLVNPAPRSSPSLSDVRLPSRNCLGATKGHLVQVKDLI